MIPLLHSLGWIIAGGLIAQLMDYLEVPVGYQALAFLSAFLLTL